MITGHFISKGVPIYENVLTKGETQVGNQRAGFSE